MKAKVLVQVDRAAALEAIRTLDALGGLLRDAELDWPKHLRRQYKLARRELVQAVGYAAHFTGIDECAVAD